MPCDGRRWDGVEVDAEDLDAAEDGDMDWRSAYGC
jgi:hypothetical protein